MSLRKHSLQALAAAHTATCTSPKRSCRGHPHLAGEVNRNTWNSLEGIPDCSMAVHTPTLVSALSAAPALAIRLAHEHDLQRLELIEER